MAMPFVSTRADWYAFLTQNLRQTYAVPPKPPLTAPFEAVVSRLRVLLVPAGRLH